MPNSEKRESQPESHLWTNSLSSEIEEEMGCGASTKKQIHHPELAQPHTRTHKRKKKKAERQEEERLQIANVDKDPTPSRSKIQDVIGSDPLAVKSKPTAPIEGQKAGTSGILISDFPILLCVLVKNSASSMSWFSSEPTLGCSTGFEREVVWGASSLQLLQLVLPPTPGSPPLHTHSSILSR